MAKKRLSKNGYIDYDEVERQVVKYLANVTDAMIRYIDDDNMVIPVDTHNLKDALGVAVYKHGKLQRLGFSSRYPEKRADVPRQEVIVDGREYRNLWGTDEIQRLMYDGQEKYLDGIWIVLLSAMPYDKEQDESGINEGWFSVQLAGEFKKTVDEIMRIYT